MVLENYFDTHIREQHQLLLRDVNTNKFYSASRLRFTIPNREAREATMVFPFDPTVAMHPSHNPYSLDSKINVCCSSTEFTHAAAASVRSPRGFRGSLQAAHEYLLYRTSS